MARPWLKPAHNSVPTARSQPHTLQEIDGAIAALVIWPTARQDATRSSVYTFLGGFTIAAPRKGLQPLRNDPAHHLAGGRNFELRERPCRFCVWLMTPASITPPSLCP